MQLTSVVHRGWDGASGGVLSGTIRPFIDDPIQCVSRAKVKKWVRSHISDQTVSSSKHTGVSIREANCYVSHGTSSITGVLTSNPKALCLHSSL